MRKLRRQWSTLSSVCESWNLESFAENTSNSSQIRSKGWSALGTGRHRFWGRYVAPLSDWIIWFKVIRIARFVIRKAAYWKGFSFVELWTFHKQAKHLQAISLLPFLARLLGLLIVRIFHYSSIPNWVQKETMIQSIVVNFNSSKNMRQL